MQILIKTKFALIISFSVLTMRYYDIFIVDTMKKMTIILIVVMIMI